MATVRDTAARARLDIRVVRDAVGRFHVVRGAIRDTGCRFVLIGGVPPTVVSPTRVALGGDDGGRVLLTPGGGRVRVSGSARSSAEVTSS